MERKFKIRKDDQVEIIAGKDKGKRGNVVRVIRDKDRVIVAGCNTVNVEIPCNEQLRTPA